MAADLTYYTIDDLRLGQRRLDGPGWRLMEFTRRSDAFQDYQTLDIENIKVLGVTNGIQALDLVRCVPVFLEHKTCEDVLVMDYINLPFWCRNPTVKQLAEECIETFRIRYGLHEFTLFPLHRKPERQIAKRNFRLLNVEGSHSPIRWIYVAGVGWLSPEEFKRRYIPPKNSDFQYPLVMKYRVDAVNKDGRILLLEIAPRDFERMAEETKRLLFERKETHEYRR